MNQAAKFCAITLMVLGLGSTSLAATDITQFGNAEYGQADAMIQGEFDPRLKKADISEIKEGRFYIRQKFQDPFDDEATTYQVFEGVPAEAATSLIPLELGGLSIQALMAKKVYAKSGSADGLDLERVYTDGRQLYIDFGDEAWIKSGGSWVKLAKSSSPNALSPVRKSGDLASSTNQVIEQSVSEQVQADDVASSIDDRFGYGSEIKAITGWTLLAAGVGMLVPAVMEHMNYDKADKAYKDTEKAINGNPEDLEIDPENWPGFQAAMRAKNESVNAKSRDAAATNRNLWAGGALIGIGAGSVVLWAF
jgi:hypothetical protein